MNNHVIFNLSLSIKAEDAAKFKSVVDRLAAETALEDGTLSYRYSISQDKTKVTIHERYVNADAAVAHITHTYAPYADQFASLTSNDYFTIEGQVNQKLKETLEGSPAIFLDHFSGFDRV